MAHDTAEEILVVVDGDGQPVDEAPRSTVHEDQLRHRAVHVLLAAGDGQVFLQKRSGEKRTYPNRWTSSASGHVPAGETLREAARREVSEELGVQAPTLSYAGWLYVEDLDVDEREFTHVFAGRHEGGFAPDDEEVSRVAAFEPHEIDPRLQVAPGAFAASFREIWRATQAGGLETAARPLEL